MLHFRVRLVTLGNGQCYLTLTTRQTFENGLYLTNLSHDMPATTPTSSMTSMSRQCNTTGWIVPAQPLDPADF